MDDASVPRIREFKRRDLKDILEIERHAFPKTSYPEEVFRHYARNPYAIFLVAELEGAVVGYLIMEKQGHVISTAVGPTHRRRGIGKRLLHCGVREARQRPWLEVRSRNKGAICFYRKVGMEVTGRSKNYYGDEDALIMTWKEWGVDSDSLGTRNSPLQIG